MWSHYSHYSSYTRLLSSRTTQICRGYSVLTEAAQALVVASVDGSTEGMQEAHSAMVQAIQSCGVMQKMAQFDAANGKKPLLVVMRQYMEMIMEMLMFIRSVRTGNWNLHTSQWRT